MFRYQALTGEGAAILLHTKVSRRFNGELDILINNAGTNDIREFTELNESFLANTMRVNYTSPVLLTQRFLPDLQKGNFGLVVNIVSDASWRPMRHSLAYNCSKAAMAMATRVMARELTKPLGIAFVSFNPGMMTGTEMTGSIVEHVCKNRSWTHKQFWDYQAANSTAGMPNRADNVADIIYAFCNRPIQHVLPMSGACIDLVG